MDEARDFANLKKMVEEVFLLRQKKMLNLALLASKSNETTRFAMALPEQKTFESLVSLLEKQRGLVENLFFSGAQKTGESRAAEGVRVKLLKDVPAFIGTDMKEYGPFSARQEIDLPFSIAKLFFERKLGERLN